MKVKIFRDSLTECHLQPEDGRLYYVHAHCDGTVAIVRCSHPYYYIAAHYIGRSMDEAIHLFFGGREELILSFLPLKEKPII